MLRLQPSELDRMDFWRAEVLIEIHKEKTEEENRKQKKQNDQQEANTPNMGSFLNQTKGLMGGLGGGLKMPKM